MKSPQAQWEMLATGQGKGCVVSEIDSSCLTIPGQRDDNRQLTRELSCLAIHSPLHPLYSRAGQKGRENENHWITGGIKKWLWWKSVQDEFLCFNCFALGKFTQSVDSVWLTTITGWRVLRINLKRMMWSALVPHISANAETRAIPHIDV